MFSQDNWQKTPKISFKKDSSNKNPRDRGAWWAVVYGVAQSQTGLKRLSSSSRPLPM